MLSPARLLKRAVATHEVQKAAGLQKARRTKQPGLALLSQGEPGLHDAPLRAPLVAVTVEQ